MLKKAIRIEYFFENPECFPWDHLKIARPGVGPLHVYLLRSSSVFYREPDCIYLNSDPSWSELYRFGKEYGGIFADIHKYCNGIDQISCRHNKGYFLVKWLARQMGFRKYMQLRLDTLNREGLFDLPTEVFETDYLKSQGVKDAE